MNASRRVARPRARSSVAAKVRRWRREFLHALRAVPSVRRAASAAGISPGTVYKWRAEDDGFAAAWDEALEGAVGDCEREAHRRGVEGVAEPVIRDGAPVFAWFDAAGRLVPEGTDGAQRLPLMLRRYSDRMLELLLRAHDPRYRDRGDQFFGPGAVNAAAGAQVVVVPATIADGEEWGAYARRVQAARTAGLPAPGTIQDQEE